VAPYDVRISVPGVGIIGTALTRTEADTSLHFDGNGDGNVAEPCRTTANSNERLALRSNTE
jgi:hypothetical protein